MKVVGYERQEFKCGGKGNTIATQSTPASLRRVVPEHGPSMSWLEGQLLDAPVEQFGDEKLVFARAGNFMDPAELAKLFARLAENSENLAVESHLVDAAGKSVRGIKNLIGRRCDTDGPWRAGRHCPCRGGGLVADGGAGIRGNGHV